jgi:hypothetical protein
LLKAADLGLGVDEIRITVFAGENGRRDIGIESSMSSVAETYMVLAGAMQPILKVGSEADDDP